LEGGTTVASVVATVLPVGLTIDGGNVNAEGDGVYVIASGGEVGTEYFILFVWTRSDGMITPDILRVRVV
jgi:hypothetical protein